jgi:hypothetical protein
MSIGRGSRLRLGGLSELEWAPYFGENVAGERKPRK